MPALSRPISLTSWRSISSLTRLDTVVLFSPVLSARAARDKWSVFAQLVQDDCKIYLPDQGLVSGLEAALAHGSQWSRENHYAGRLIGL